MRSDAVQAKDLVLGYGSTVALSKSTFSIPTGKVTAVIGPNGSGKSTLLNAVAGLIDPISGSIEVFAAAGSSHRISYVLQTTKVNDALPISVREMVTMGRYAGTGAYRWLSQDDRDAVAKAMDRTGITDLGNRPLNDLSGGQRQRVFVAQGLAQEHDLLLLDEPLTGIDFPTAQAIDFVIHDELARGCTVVMTTHDLSEAQVADNVILLSGRVVAHGSPREVLTTGHLQDAYGAALLHVEDGRIFLDDAAHRPVEGRHVHRDRVIHTESSQSDLHNK
ncbi:MAG: metal ABC transporter ATP-binding protein [Acidimicrobiia bacterium]